MKCFISFGIVLNKKLIQQTIMRMNNISRNKRMNEIIVLYHQIGNEISLFPWKEMFNISDGYFKITLLFITVKSCHVADVKCWKGCKMNVMFHMIVLCTIYRIFLLYYNRIIFSSSRFMIFY